MPSRRSRSAQVPRRRPEPAAVPREAPGGVHLPQPTVWPCLVGLGATLLAFGLVTSLAFSVAGALAVALGLAGWIGELLRA